MMCGNKAEQREQRGWGCRDALHGARGTLALGVGGGANHALESPGQSHQFVCDTALLNHQPVGCCFFYFYFFFKKKKKLPVAIIINAY